MSIQIDLIESIVLILIFFIPIIGIIIQGSQLEKANKKIRVLEALIFILQDENQQFRNKRQKGKHE